MKRRDFLKGTAGAVVAAGAVKSVPSVEMTSAPMTLTSTSRVEPEMVYEMVTDSMQPNPILRPKEVAKRALKALNDHIERYDV